ncbi:MAG TPA: beta-L-arabinofuranosidase domain-containing protein [Acidobacteriota bacterium]|nr:beta-L-arabinofuranosidase domain-containing protein [Acidobacteriota bacterium]
MRTSLLVLFLGAGMLMAACGTTEEVKDYPIKAVAFTNVRLADGFWQARIETNRTATIPHAFEKCEETGRIENFAFAGGLKQGVHNGGYCFNDSDVYKTIEGAAYSLAAHPDSELEAYVDGVIEQIAAAQEEDGYLYTARTAFNPEEPVRGGEERWSDVRWGHELYCAGHLYEGAVAYYQATGKRQLLDVALKNANLICEVFGPDGRKDPPGHQEIEIGLVKLYRVTGEKKYLDQAELFLERRGHFENRESYGEYAQDHKPIVEQDEAVGHAVRAAYMYSGIADVAALTGNEAYVETLERLWEATAARKLYLTGGIGAQGSGEAFSGVYELPNMSAYAETCASIANVFWNHRMFLLTGESKYLDGLERILYNAALAGVSMEGKAFFYPNPLESVGQNERSPWFNCACCPPNVARFIASMPGYIYATGDDRLYVNLYAAGEADVEVNGRQVKIIQETGYPWDGAVRLTMGCEVSGAEFALMLRIPGWSQGKPMASDLYNYVNAEPADVTLKVNGEALPLELEKGFALISRTWNNGDVVELELPMIIRRVVAHEKVTADAGRVALERGPIVFCAEWPDNEGSHVRNLMLPDASELTTEYKADLLNGVQVIRGGAVAYEYRDEGTTTVKHEREFTAIPYYAWAHRGRGEMAVWLAREEAAVHPLNEPTIASTSTVTASSGRNPEAVNDQLEPASSNDQEVPFYHWWPAKGTTEWIEYEFDEPKEVAILEVYWFDDTGEGECRVPQSWRILYRDGEEWRPVYSEEGVYGVEKDRFNKVVFETVKTTAVRLEIQSQPDFAGGIHEWKIK